MARKGTTIS